MRLDIDPGKAWSTRKKSLFSQAGLARMAATITTLCGLVALTGWVFHLSALTSVVPGSVEMKANTAVAIVLCGIGLLVLSERSSLGLERFAQSTALLAAAIGLATLVEYLFGWQLGIDEWLFRDVHKAYNTIPGRMSPYSAAAFVTLGVALAIKPVQSLHRLSRFGGLVVIIIGLLSLVGYLWNAEELITDRWLPPVAINTATCFVLLGAGILLTLTPNQNDSNVERPLVLANVEIKILTGFLVAMVLLLFGGSYTYRTGLQFADSVEWVAHRQEVRAAVAKVYGSLAGTELALRDYLVFGGSDRWQEYERLMRSTMSNVDDVERLTSDDPAQRNNRVALKSLVNARVQDLSGVIAAYESFGLPAARAITKIQQQLNSTRDVAVIAERMDTVEARLLAGREQATENVREHTLVSMLITLAVASAVFIALFRGIQREMIARREVEDVLRASDQYNRSIVEGSPDCLAILTSDACLREMTPRGLSLMGIDDFSSISGTDWLDLWSSEAQAAARTAVAEARGGTAGRFQGHRTAQDGTHQWWDVIIMPIRGADGSAVQLLATARDITQRKLHEQSIRELNAELRDKASELEAINTDLESFSSSVSHDLRAPLHAIDGFAVMLEEYCKDQIGVEGRRYLSMIRHSGQKMASLIDDLLAFSRLGRQPIARRGVNVESLVREIIEEFQGSTALPRMEVGALPPALGDRGLLRQVWVNLIANAIKYSAKAVQPVVRISGHQVGAENHYSVKDNGVGFDMQYVDQLFGVFHRLHSVEDFGGTGVGLAIVHRIVTRHGGRVWANGKVDHGAEFAFALPNHSAADLPVLSRASSAA